MKGKTKVFKLLLMMILTLTTVFVIAGCARNTDATDIEEAKSVLAIVYASGDNADSVTQNLVLPTSGVNEVEITWTTSHSAIVTQAGVVTRPTVDTNVTLTATLTKGEESDTKEFIVKVIKAPVVTTPQEALDALEITGDDLEEDEGIYSTSEDIVLPTTSLGLAVNWESSATAITTSGVVTRPEYGQSNARVILTAYIGNLEKEFIVDVLAIVDMPAAQILSTASTQLILSPTEVVENITFPTSIVVEGVYDELYTASVSWVSSDTNYITNTGVVTRPGLEESDEVVTLTATITYQDQTTTKEIQIRVLAEAEPYEEFETFAAAQAYYLDDVDGTSDRRYVKILDVSVIGIMDDGLMFVDSEGDVFFAFGSQSNAYRNAKPDQLYDVIGNLAYYFGVIQINGTGSAFSRQPTILIEKEGEPSTVNPTVVENLVDYLPETMPTYSLTNIFEMEYLRLEAKVYVQSEIDNYGIFLVDVNYDGDYSDIDAKDKSVPYTNEAIVIYYTSNNTALAPLHGLTVTIDIVMFGLRDDRLIYNAVFLGVIGDVEVHEMTDEQAVAAVKQTLEMSTPNALTEETTIDLITELFGTTIVWSSDNEDVISTDGVVTPVDGERIAVTLTAAITRGDAVEEFEIVILVGELPVLTIEEALAITTTDNIKVKGTVVGYSGNDTVILHDETGAMALFIGSGTPTTNADMIKSSFGKVVIIEGYRSEHNGLEQLRNIVDVEVTTENAHILKVDITDLDWTSATLLTHQSKLVSITGGTVSDVAVDQYDNIAVTITLGEKSIVIRWDARVAITGGANILANAEVDDLIDVIDAPLTWVSNNPQIGYYVSGQATVEADPSLERHDVVFMDGEDEVETIQVVDGRKILDYPTMSKEGFAFVGWYLDEEFTLEWITDTEVEEDTILYAKWIEIEVYTHYTFGAAAVVGYGEGEITFTEAFGEVTLNKDRVQINTSNFAPHNDDIFLVLSIRDTSHLAYIEFDFSDEEDLTHISFEISVWNQTNINTIKNLAGSKFILQVQQDSVWVDLETIDGSSNLLEDLTVDVYTKVTFAVDGAGMYRIIYSGPATASSNTVTATTVDNLKLYRSKVELQEPVEVTFDLNYDDSDDPTIVVVEKDELVTQPLNPSRSGYTFLGWALFGETDLFDFDTPITEDITLVALWEEIVIMTIAEAATKAVNEEVLFVGVVTGFDGWNTTYNNWSKAFMEDETGTIVLHNPALPIDVEIGDVFHVEGQIGEFNGLIQVAQGATYTPAEGEFDLPAPEVITDLDVLDNVLYQGRRISLSGDVVSVSSSGQVMVIELDGSQITIRAVSSTGDINDLFKEAVVGQTVNITEIHVDWFNGPQLFPTSVNQFDFVELTDMDKLQAAKVILEETFEGKSFNMGTAVPTPSLGDDAITVEDVVSDPVGAIVIVEEVQVWDDVTENTVYTISLTLKLGVEELPVSVTVTVIYVDSSEPLEVVLYETSFESSSAKGSYAEGTMDDEGTDWILTEAVRGNLADDKKIGSWAIRGRGPGYARINQEYDNLTKIEFNYAHYGSLTLGVLSLQASADGGTTWINVWTMPEGTQSDLLEVAVELEYDDLDDVDFGDSLMVQWVFGGPSGNNSRMNLDGIKLYGFTE